MAPKCTKANYVTLQANCYFSVGEYASESMREFVVQLLDKIDSGEPVLLS